jgi:hypothetical protein
MNRVIFGRPYYSGRFYTGLLSISIYIVLGCGTNHKNGIPPNRQDSVKGIQLSLRQIDDLGPHPTYQDVYNMIQGADPIQEILMLACPAKDGGVYFFLFCPTHEIPGKNPEFEYGSRDSLFKLPLIAVVWSESYGTDNLTYVWPKYLKGKRCAAYGCEENGERNKGVVSLLYGQACRWTFQVVPDPSGVGCFAAFGCARRAAWRVIEAGTNGDAIGPAIHAAWSWSAAQITA